MVSDAGFEGIYGILASEGMDSGLSRFQLLQMAYGDLSLYAEHASRIVQLFRYLDQRSNAVAMLIMQVVDIENRTQVMELLPPQEQIHVEKRLKSFDHVNPSGHYRLDLSNRLERTIVLRLTEISNKECRLREDNEDTIELSQSGNGQAWRNETLDGRPFVFDAGWHIPTEGILE